MPRGHGDTDYSIFEPNPLKNDPNPLKKMKKNSSEKP